MNHSLSFPRFFSVFVIGVVAIGSAVFLTASADDSSYVLDRYDQGALRVSQNSAFGYGEKLTFNVGYKFIIAGTATMQIGQRPASVGGRPCYEVAFDVTTTPNFDKVFRVRDRYRTYIDQDGVFPWRFEQTVREGKYSRDFSANIDQRSHVAKTTEGSFRVPPFVHDILSAFYYVRTLNLGSMSKGQSFQLQNFYGKQAYELRVKVLGKDRVKVDAGTFDCVVVEPLVQEGGLFKSEGRIIVWLSDDALKIPVKVSAKVPVGAIEGRLKSYSGLRGALSSKQ